MQIALPVQNRAFKTTVEQIRYILFDDDLEIVLHISCKKICCGCLLESL